MVPTARMLQTRGVEVEVIGIVGAEAGSAMAAA